MPGADRGPLDPEVEDRLRRELDALQPRWSSPRYLTARRGASAWRLAPVALAAAILAMAGLSAYAGSPNPVVWTEHVLNVHPAGASPTPAVTPPPSTPTARPDASPDEHESPEPSESPEPHESPEPSGSPDQHESPEPSGGGSDGSGGGTDGGSGSSSGDDR